MRRAFQTITLLSFSIGLSACGTTYKLPELGEVQTQQATKMFAEARAEGPRNSISPSSATKRFHRVSARVSKVGQKYCQATTAEKRNFNCNVNIAIDHKMKERNAYFTYDNKNPIIRMSMPLLQDTASDDEVAFILSHEYGHLIGRHIEKQQQQALTGALILGTLAAAASAQSASSGGYYDNSTVEQSMELGAAVGSMAYSQKYELESDTLGTRITSAAGYDPVEGAKFFARPEKAKTSAGKLSFWGTHPPDEKRLATVLATVAQIEAQVGLQRVSSKKPVTE